MKAMHGELRLRWVLGLTAAAVSLLLTCGCSKEKRAAGHLAKADAFFEQGNYDAARIEYMNAARLAPGDARAISRLAIIFQDQGALLLAAGPLIQAVELLPGDADLHSRLARVYLAVGEVDKARAEAWTALDLNPAEEAAVLLLAEAPLGTNDLASVRQRLGQLRQRAGDPAVYGVADAVFALRQQDVPGADAALEQALAKDGQLAAAYFLQGGIRQSQTNLVEAGAALKRAAELSPIRSIRQVRYAEFLVRQEQVDAAKAWLAQVVEKAPDYLPALTTQAELALAEQRYDDCLKLCDQVIGRYPPHLEAGLLRARVQLVKREPAKAVEELQRLTRTYGRSPQLRYQMAVAQLANQEPNSAIASLEQAIQLDTNYVDAVVLLARLNLGRGQAEAAEQALIRVVQARPELFQVRLLLADAYIARQQYDAALAIYQEFQKAFPKDPRGPFMAGLVLRQQKKFDEARAEFNQALGIEPKFVPATVQLVELDLVERKLAAALQQAEATVAAAPDQAGAHLLLARVQLAQTNLVSAETTLKKTLELDPNLTGAYLMLAGVYRDGQRLPQSLQQLDQLLEKSPKDTTALMLKGTIHSEMGDHDQARAAYEQILTINPNFSPALNNLAYLHTERLPDLDKAWSYGRRARELLPNSPEAADTLGWVHYQRGEYPDALWLLLEAAEKLPSEPELQYHLGMTYVMMAQEGAARAAFERSLQSTADFPGKAEAQERLALLNATSASGPQARQQLEARVKAEPRDVLALLRLADLQIADGDVAQAQETLAAALKLNPSLPQALLTQARLLAQKGQRDEALRMVRQARERAGGDADLAWQGGQVALQCGDPFLALAQLQDAARRGGDRPEILADLAMATYLSGRIDEAESICQRVIQANPPAGVLNSARELEWLIQAYRNPAVAAQQGETQLKGLMQRSPDSAPVLMAMGSVLGRQGKPAEARALYDKVLAQLPTFAPAQRELAVLYAGPLKDDAKAYELAVKARQAMSSDAGLTKTLGLLTYRRGDYRYAAQLLTEASKTLGQDGEVFCYLGLAQLQLKQTAEAKASLEKALALEPGAPWAAEARKGLE